MCSSKICISLLLLVRGLLEPIHCGLPFLFEGRGVESIIRCFLPGPPLNWKKRMVVCVA